MDKDKWLKAIKCSKEELIEWLNEMYEDDKRLKEIITKYEDTYNVGIEEVEEAFYDPLERNQKMMFYTKVKTKNFEYKRNW